MTAFTTKNPVALLVEDKPELLKAKQNLFTVSGFQAICVRTAAEAMREFIATPAVDIIVADLNLDSANEQDLSGMEVAARIREMRPDVPIVAVSGQIDSLSTAQRQPFTDSLIKGKKLTLGDYDAMLEKWRSDAIAYRERRTSSSKRAVEALEARAEATPVDYEVLREFLPGRQIDHRAAAHQSSIHVARRSSPGGGMVAAIDSGGKNRCQRLHDEHQNTPRRAGLAAEGGLGPHCGASRFFVSVVQRPRTSRSCGEAVEADGGIPRWQASSRD